jgi:hypothetical protein
MDEIPAREEQREAVDRILGEVVVLSQMRTGDWINFTLAHPDVNGTRGFRIGWNVPEQRFRFDKQRVHPYFFGKVLDMVKKEGLL